MNPWILPVGIGSVLFLSGTAVSLFTIYYSRASLAAVARRAAEDRAELDKRLETLTAQIQELRQEPPIPTPSGPLKPGFNLSKRSQALRMHRRGDPPAAIATTLDVPCQEVELLLKVHGIVLEAI